MSNYCDRLLLTTSAIDCKEPFWIARCYAIGDLLLWIIVTIVGEHLQHFDAGRTILGHRRIIHRKLGQWRIVVHIVDAYEHLFDERN